MSLLHPLHKAITGVRVSTMMSFTHWHKIGICAGLIGFTAGCALMFGGDVLSRRAFEILMLPLIAVFIGSIAVGIYCWVRIMKVVGFGGFAD